MSLTTKRICRKITYAFTTNNNETINKVTLRFQNENPLSKNISEGIKTENTKTLHFYLKLKIHKEGNPGIPVISSINCHTSKISEYVDYQLQPNVKETPSYVQNTIDFLRKINENSRQLISCFCRCSIIIHQYFKCRRNQICENVLGKLF